MKTVDRLVREHDLIERGLALLEQTVAKLDAGQPVPDGFTEWAPEFFARFADKCHHAKEEDLFFPLLKERGIPEDGGPIGVMLYEHTLGRECVGRMRDAAAGDSFDAASFAEAARAYAPLLRQHIFKENNVLFKMAQQVLSIPDDDALDERFTHVESERELAGLYDQYADDVERWEAAFG